MRCVSDQRIGQWRAESPDLNADSPQVECFKHVAALCYICFPATLLHTTQGTLRDALDRRLLPHQPNSSLLNPTVAVALAHDIAAAMLHLHTEGIV